jgi:hypothetical protein
MNQKQIQSNLGSAFLDLSVGGSAGEVQLKTSNTFTDTFLYMVTSGYSINYVPHNFDASKTMYVEMDHIQYGNGSSAPVLSVVNNTAGNISYNGEMWFGMNHYEASGEVGGLFIGVNYSEHKTSHDLKNVATILSSRNSTVQSGLTTTNDVIIGGKNHVINTGVSNSVVLGGQNITATATDTVYVPYLNISNATSGTSVGTLKIDSSGNVITGDTLEGIGEICYLCNYVFTGDTGTTLTITDGITDVLTEEPLEGDVTVGCTGGKCCTQWSVYYVEVSNNTKTENKIVANTWGQVQSIESNPNYFGVKVDCISTNSTGTQEGGKEHHTNIRLKTIPSTATEPIPILIDNEYDTIASTNTEGIHLKDVYMVKVDDSSGVSVENSTLIGVSGSSYTIVEGSINTFTNNSSFTKILTSRDSLISNSVFTTMMNTKKSTITDSKYTSVISSDNVTVSNVEGTSIIAGKNIVASQDYTLYTSGLYVDDKEGLNLNSLQVSAPVNSGCTFVVTSGGTVGVKTCDPDFDLEVNGTFGATSKSFVIPHPTKEGKKLVYGAIEGPEFGVYDRGRFFDGVITLPEEWTGLVDETTITVQLTGDGFFMSPYVKEVKDNKVFVGNRFPFISPTGFYTVYGERKDIDKIKKEIDV